MTQRQLYTLNSGIRDNHRRGSVGDFLRQAIQPQARMAVVSAYFTIYAYEVLKTKLDEIEHLRFLFGEPRFINSLDPERTQKKHFDLVDGALHLTNQLQQKRVARECAAWIRERVAIRSVKKANFLHGKMYYVDNGGRPQAILGSSNFTTRGLGLSDGHNNIELNLEVDNGRDLDDLMRWFDELWEDRKLVVDVKEEVLAYLAKLYQNHSPQFVYYKTLFHLFEQYLQEQEAGDLLDSRTHFFDTQIWQALFEFQKDGVKAAINKIQQYNGCVIADSVGLGKTYEALAVIKYFELRNERVLVLCPKKLRENWTVYQAQNNSELNPFPRDRFGYTVLSHTDLSRNGGRSGDVDLASLNWGNYDLVVIDESHNFRNNTKGKRDEEGNRIRKSRYERVMEDILQAGIKTKVLLLSATPVNTDLSDLRNQLYFLTEGRDDAFQKDLGIASLKETLAAAQRTFTNWAKESANRETGALLESLSSAFFKLLDALTIARSRKHIQRHYPETVRQLGGFPERQPPQAIFPEIDSQAGQAEGFPDYNRINQRIINYKLALFNPSAYVLPAYAPRYAAEERVGNFSQKQRESYLIGMMKVNFLKRLESSIHSFRVTMERTLAKMDALEARIERFRKFQAERPDLDLATLDLTEIQAQIQEEAEEDEELAEAMQVGKNLTFQMAHLDLDGWLADLRMDRSQIQRLYDHAQRVTPARDAKLAELRQLIRQKVENPTQDKEGYPNRKVLIFTHFADTATYLYNQIQQWARHDLGVHIALVTGGSGGNRTTLGSSDFNHILTNFSPRSKRRGAIPTLPQDEAIEVLIATDCISEGQNLQDCDYLINYDIHWNPVRLIQRFGRIDRIGSVNRQVHMVNFWPTPDLNEYINLQNRVEARMALVDVTATQEDNVLQSPREIAQAAEGVIQQELRYRDQQLLRMRDEILDLEDFNESVTLTDFTLDDFRLDLTRFIENNREVLRQAPLGLYAVVPADARYPTIRPGVIWCLRHEGSAAESETINPLQPHYLVYIQEDGEVRHTFAQPKQILDIYRTLCAEQDTPHQALCDLFDQETDNGQQMAAQDRLMQQAVRSVERTFQRRAVSSLLSGRDGKIGRAHV